MTFIAVISKFIQFFSLFDAKTRYGRLDTAKNLGNSLWSLGMSRSPKF